MLDTVLHAPTALIPWLDPVAIIEGSRPWALLVVCFIVFAETGLLIGFLLPGDTLLMALIPRLVHQLVLGDPWHHAAGRLTGSQIS